MMLKLPFFKIAIAISSSSQIPINSPQSLTAFSTDRRPTSLMLSLLAVGVLALAGCQNRSTGQGQPNTATAPVPAATIAPAAPNAAQPNPQATRPTTVAPNAVPTQPSVAVAPNTAVSNTVEIQLPQTLVRKWEPESNVLFDFGSMTITPDTISWNGGQSSPYSVISTHAGYVLRLETAPKFFGTPQPYIKLIPKTDESGKVNEVDVAFFESQQKVENNEYIMLGTYVVQ